MVLALFLAAFVIGPALFLVLARRDWRPSMLALVASFLVVFSLFLRHEASLTPTTQPPALFLSIVSIWLAWILVLLLLARALRTAWPAQGARRWIRAGCAMGTTLPWFGFAAAQLMVKP